MTQDDLMNNVRAKLKDRPAISANWIQQRHHVLQSQAHDCIKKLQEDGLIEAEWNTNLGGYRVVPQPDPRPKMVPLDLGL